MARSDNGMLFFYDWIDAFQELPAKDFKDLTMAMFRYHRDGEEPPKFKGKAAIIASFVFPALARSKVRAAAGKKGGQASVQQRQANETFASSKNQANGNQNSTTKTKTKTKTIDQDKDNAVASGNSEAASRFATFWESYPKKIGKTAASAAFERLNPDAELFETIMTALESHKRSAQWTKDGGQYIPNPVTWIDQRRWEDELPVPAEQNQANGSFDTDEFFEAALAKSLRDQLQKEGENDGQNGE